LKDFKKDFLKILSEATPKSGFFGYRQQPDFHTPSSYHLLPKFLLTFYKILLQ